MVSKKVIIFSLTYFPFIGGAEVAVKEITDRMGDVSFDLITARLDGKLSKYEKIGNVNVFRVGLGCGLDKYLFPFFAYHAANKLHKKNDYDVVHAIMAFYAGLAAVFFKMMHPKVKYLLTMQSGDSNLFVWLRTWFWYPAYRLIYTKPDHIQAISWFLAERARQYGYKGDVDIIPNGVDSTIFRMASQEEVKNIRNKLNIGRDEKVIITVSRLVKKNGVNDLIKAMCYLNFPCKLLIVGAGKDEKKLRFLVAENRLNNKILFVGHVDHSDLYKYLSAADVFVRPSLSEGFGNVFAEALACGTPIVGTDVGGSCVRLLRGLICERRNSQSVATQIKKILSEKNPQKYVEEGQNLLKEYTWDKISCQMKEIYLKI